MKVHNMVSERSGNAIANQFVIFDNGKVTFQSYQSTIATIDGINVTLGRMWDYSKTTTKYLYQFLRQYAVIPVGMLNKKGIEKLIADGLIAYNENMA